MPALGQLFRFLLVIAITGWISVCPGEASDPVTGSGSPRPEIADADLDLDLDQAVALHTSDVRAETAPHERSLCADTLIPWQNLSVTPPELILLARLTTLPATGRSVEHTIQRNRDPPAGPSPASIHLSFDSTSASLNEILFSYPICFVPNRVRLADAG